MLSHGSTIPEFNVSDGDDIFPFPATVLRGFGVDPPHWEISFRLLLRRKVDLHLRVPKNFVFEMGEIYPCEVSEYGTPLDESFRMTETLFEAEKIESR